MSNETYTCAICSTPYNSIEARIACETKCLKKRKDAEAKKKLEEQQKKVDEAKKQKRASEQAIETKLDEVNKMLKEHFANYESFNMTQNYYYLRWIFNKPMFWF